ncbi:hypothetical protein [Rhizobium sp. C1]|uniref:hypothetical protein n=1 Tax=Rhizobium sp. C1 TaxID=1349799 RepID=UPI001E2F37B6|nr:hypothetical protein [Rhizobium sp. C1]MCD2180205.1 hypothetical protein [Rhizobium sp. C1]
MRPRIIMLTGVTHANRHQVTADINDAVVSAGGWVSDHTFLSNIATNFRMVLPPQGLARFRDLVTTAGVHLDAESETAVADLIANEKGLPEELPASLNVTFIHDEPDLRREVPAVPG